MRNYTGLKERWSDLSLREQVSDYLVEIWVKDYLTSKSKRNLKLVETSDGNFSYLFDITNQRLIAAWGFSRGKSQAVRDKVRMAGHPLSAGTLYHRGHAIAHSLGGGTDINLGPQLGKINSGIFRKLEKLAVENPGSFYFTYWQYPPTDTQIARKIEQGLLLPDGKIHISQFEN